MTRRRRAKSKNEAEVEGKLTALVAIGARLSRPAQKRARSSKRVPGVTTGGGMAVFQRPSGKDGAGNFSGRGEAQGRQAPHGLADR